MSRAETGQPIRGLLCGSALNAPSPLSSESGLVSAHKGGLRIP